MDPCSAVYTIGISTVHTIGVPAVDTIRVTTVDTVRVTAVHAVRVTTVDTIGVTTIDAIGIAERPRAGHAVGQDLVVGDGFRGILAHVNSFGSGEATSSTVVLAETGRPALSG